MDYPSHLELVAWVRVVAVVTGYPEDVVGMIANHQRSLRVIAAEHQHARAWEHTIRELLFAADLPDKDVPRTDKFVMGLPAVYLRSELDACIRVTEETETP